jgi:hypothetical protein
MYLDLYTGKATSETANEKKLKKIINSKSKKERLLLIPFYMRDTYTEGDGTIAWIKDLDEHISKKDINKYLKQIR